MELRNEALQFYLQCISSKISNATETITQCEKALMYIGAIVHCFTTHSSEFIAKGLVGDIQTLNCNDLNSWGFSTDVQTYFIQCKKIKARLESEARIEFVGTPAWRKLNVPLNRCSTEILIPAIVGTLLHNCFTFDAIFFTNVLLFYIRFAFVDFKQWQ